MAIETQTEEQSSITGTRAGRAWIAAGAALGFLGVAAGAAGTHALRGTLDASAMNTFETAVRFQMYHALALLAVGLLARRRRSRLMDVAGGLLAAGAVLFCGSLYLLALTGAGAFGAVAPIGGASMLAGWAALFIAALKR